MDLTGRTAIVTGAAGGIGRAIAVAMAKAGAKVAVGDITPGVAPRTVEQIGGAGGEAFFRHTDVSRWEDVDGIVAEAVSRWGRLDVIVNNAAWFPNTDLLATDDERWQRALGVNVTGMFYGCKRAVQQFLTQEPAGEVRGRIVNITSQHGMIAAPGDFAYGVTKSAGVYMTRQIAADYARDGIVCNAVAPGKILSGGPFSDLGEKALSYSRSRTPWPRLGQPEDVASAVVFLASDAARYITGHNLMVDGGWMAA